MNNTLEKSNTPEEILRTLFGYDSFLGTQEEIIKHISAGNDALVLAPTGGGKSLCYQLPAIIRPGIGIVVSPLISLMQDQVDTLRQIGVKAAFLNSSLGMSDAMQIERAMVNGEIDLLYVAPERLLTDRFQNLLAQTALALFAIDEAHCVSQWGHDFRPEYIQLSILHERFPAVPRIALTATADSVTRQEIVTKLGLVEARQFVSSFDRPNIRYRVVLKQNPKNQLLDFIRWEHEDDAGIVYCLSRNKVEQTAQWLSDHGYTALPYHAGLDSETRLVHQRRFQQEEGVIVVATVAFGMGIDKPDVRFVAHLDLPKSMEGYYQETGRAGRDGRKADAWMAYSLADVVLLRKILEGSEADERYKQVEKRKLEALLGYCETARCRRQVMLSYFGEELSEPCGNCDTCLETVETWDGSVAAQKALSCVFRTGQRFGATYLADVLLGQTNMRIQRFGHDSISTYGIGTELTASEWKSVFRQLIAADLLKVDIEGYGGFKLTPKSKGVLKGEQQVLFRRDPTPIKRKRKKKAVQTLKLSGDPAVQRLWEALRKLRREIAKQQNMPPYVIFHDKTLWEMAELRPQTLDQLSGISGVGASKLERYGKIFLDVVRCSE
ncbi:MAG: DNA helicase RecQ [Proteobacteria bacterium]|nr:DNA helicase RecQ [Pseudomonadota bacterium]